MKRAGVASREMVADGSVGAAPARPRSALDPPKAFAIQVLDMARAISSGAISFGLVNVPVKLYSATSPKSVRFHQLSSKTGARIRQKRVDPTTDEEVPYEDIVKGYEITPDRYVLIDDEELDALDPKATRTIDIEEFVDLAEIDPIYYDHNYYLVPDGRRSKAYRLLLDAMRESGKIGSDGRCCGQSSSRRRSGRRATRSR